MTVRCHPSPGERVLVDGGSHREPLRLLAVGDSVARGFRFGLPDVRRSDSCRLGLYGVPLRWFDHVDDAYPTLLARMLADRLGRTVLLDRSATCSGASTRHLVRDGVPSPVLAAAVARRPEVVTVTLGANDVLEPWYGYVVGTTLMRPFEHLIRDALLARLHRMLAPSADDVDRAAATVPSGLGAVLGYLRRVLPSALIVTTGYFGAEGGDRSAERFVQPLNRAIAAAVARAEEVVLIELDPVFRGHRAAWGRAWFSRADRAHPSREGQRVIAETLAAAIGPRLRAAA